MKKQFKKNLLALSVLLIAGNLSAQEGTASSADEFRKLQQLQDKNVPVEQNTITVSNSPTQIRPAESVNLPQNAARGISPQDLKKLQLKYDQENARMNMDHIKKMRQKAINNAAKVFDTMLARQQELQKMSRNNILNNKDGTEVMQRAQEIQKEIADLSASLNKAMEQESIAFQKMMQQRTVQLATETAAISVQPVNRSEPSRPLDPRGPASTSVVRQPASDDAQSADQTTEQKKNKPEQGTRK